MPFAELPDLTMHYVSQGAGSEPIVLIHGNLASVRWWDKFLNRLPLKYQAFAMDLRGCGKSGKPDQGHTIAQFAADIMELTRLLQVPSFHLLGHSMGGQIAMYLTLHWPQAVKTLALLDTVPAAGLALDDTIRDGFALLQQDRTVLQQAMASCMQYADDNGEAARIAFADAAACSAAVYRDNPETMHDTVLVDRLGELAVPVLIMHGREDLIIPLAAVESTMQAFPQAEKMIFERCGHSPQLEIPEVFASTYLRFLERYSTGG